ncbi:DUF4437 domain-containing protein [Algoriphagus sp. H41]|uniref:DUF4437 domain-containing protein n=1 Tax=Algoriphagus oliviformis TaxID=2811231 RepID=A0ABS3CCJ7_9BACT|nr:DUF4437 domain-containing protein [Algoriphagus oliviformis]MBN7813354.1 DUF4437 domain-containing protein [Algoriphagus oliviformis]
MKFRIITALVVATSLMACAQTNSSTIADETKEATSLTIENLTNAVVLSSEVKWEKLNPARGDASPQAGTLWGDRKGKVATGFLGKFADGFSSPPHIHNVTYRAVVISGSIHNDDPSAEKMWMKPGSFWTQPVGEAHITAAKGDENIAYVEIDHGPYLVKPTEEAFDNGERPVTIDASNVVWLSSDKAEWIAPNSGAALSFLWENENLKGLFIKLPQGFKGRINSEGDIFHAVVIQGNLAYKLPQSGETKAVDAGSYFTSSTKAKHDLITSEEVVIYGRTNGELEVM